MKKNFWVALVAVFLSLSGFAQIPNLSEGFEDGWPPDGWKVKNVSGIQQWMGVGDFGHSGASSVFISDGGNFNSYLISPQVSVFENTVFSFFYSVEYPSYASNTTFTVEIATDTSVSSYNVLETINLGSCVEGNWYEKIIDLSDYVGQNVFIIFHDVNNYGAGIYLDDIEIATCPSPKGLAASDITAHTAHISWMAVEGNTYSFSYKAVEDDEWSDEIFLTEGSYDFSSLNADTQYQVRVYSSCVAGEFSAYSILNFITDVACNSPKGLIVSAITPHSAKVTWNTVEGAESYKFAYKIDDDDTWVEQELTDTTINLSDLLADTGYEVKVSSDCGDEGASVTSTTYFTTDIACNKPANLHYTDITDNSVTIVWNSPSMQEVSSYILSYKENIESAEWSDNIPVTDTTYTIYSLNPTTAYVVKVSSDCGTEGNSVASQLTFMTMGVPVTVPYMQDFESAEPITDFQIQTYGPNAWVIGSATAKLEESETEGHSLYVSKDSGVSNSYNKFSSSNSWAVLTVNFGDDAAYKLSFDYKGEGEFGYDLYDYISVYVAPTNAKIPSGTNDPTMSNSFVKVFEQDDSKNEWTHVETNIYGVSNQMCNVIFHWANDGSGGADPAGAIDNISIEGISCAGAYNLVASDISTNGATITWQQGGDVSSWNVKYRKVGDASWITETVSEPTVTLSSLNNNTNYELFVETICGEDENPTSGTITFKTFNVAVSVPYEQTFEDEEISDFDFISYGPNAWVIGSATAKLEEGEESGKSMYISNDNGLTNTYDYHETNSYAVLTATFGDKAEYHLSFDYKVKGEDYDYLSVYVAPASEVIPSDDNYYAPDFPDTFVPLMEQINFVNDWKHVDFVLSDVQNSTKNIIFFWRNDDNDWYDEQPPAAIDNISITGSDCATPTNLTIGNITSSTANISWSQQGDVSSWNVKYKPTTASEWQSVEVSDTSYTISDLEAGTIYNVYVEGICSDGSYPNSVIDTFVTVCLDIDLSVVEDNKWKNDFESSTSFSAMCLNVAQVGTYYNFTYPTISSISDAHIGVNDGTSGAGSVAEFSGSKGILALPKFTDDISQLNLKFWYRHNAYSTATAGTMQVGVMTDLDDISTFTAVATVDASLSNSDDDSYYLANVDFSATELTGNNYYIALKYNNTSNYYYWYIDDMEVGYVPACSGIDINSVVISDITSTTAIVDFTDPNVAHTAWRVYYKPVTGTEYISEDTENKFVTLSGLIPETEYTIYVVTVCDDEESELKSVAKTFTTDVACPSPKNVKFTEITENSATVAWSSTTESSSWKVSYKAASSEDWSAEYPVTDTTYELIGLESATTYLVKIVADCAPYTSQPTQVSFTTTNVPVNVPYVQDFELGIAITDFQVFTYGGQNAWAIGTATAKMGEGDYGGSSMYVSNDNGTTNSYDVNNTTNSYAVLTVNFGDATEYTLSFDYKVPGGEDNYDYLTVYMAPTTAVIPTPTTQYNIPESFTKILEKVNSQSAWTNVVFALTGVSNTTQNIVFYWRNDVSGGTQTPAAIDNISITSSNCAKPTNVSVSNVTSTTATVSWSADSGITSWLVKYKKENESQWQEATATTTSYSLTGLEIATTYQVMVASVCGEENAVSDEITFKTLCNTIIVTDATPWIEDFATEDALDCWTYEPYVWSYANYSQALYHDHEWEGASDYADSPVFDLTGVTNPYIAFKYKLILDELYETNFDILKVFYRASQMDDWTQLATYTDQDNIYHNDTLALPSKSATYQIAFYLENLQGGGVYVDDIKIFNKIEGEQPQPCDAPTSLTVTNTTQTSATITWEGSAALYELQLDGNAPQDVAATTYTFNDLTAGTTYTVKVRAVCSEETTSDWATITFTTEEDETPEPCDAPTNVTASEITQTTAVINWEGSAETYEVTVGDKAPVNVSAKSYACSGLTANTTYIVKVRSICGEDNFSEFATTTFKTLEDESGLTDVENELSVKVYPNPTTDNTTLEIKGINGIARVIVTDVNGRVIDEKNVSDGVETITINSERYASGVYYIRVMGEGINKTTTLIKK